jgi:hypothetical protein
MSHDSTNKGNRAQVTEIWSAEQKTIHLLLILYILGPNIGFSIVFLDPDLVNRLRSE